MSIPAHVIELLGRLEVCPIGQILGTGYWRFFSPWGIDGLAKWQEDRLDLLAVAANAPGRGHFREFIKQAQKRFRTICIWHDMNPIVAPMLVRYGFAAETEIQGDGEVVPGWRWDRPA